MIAWLALAALLAALPIGWWIGYTHGLRVRIDGVAVEQLVADEAYTSGWHDGRAIGVQIGLAAAEELAATGRLEMPPRGNYRIDPGTLGGGL